MTRKISEIAKEITQEWVNVHYAAKPYLKAMLELEDITDYYGFDSASSVINYFLSNARSFRGKKS